MIQTTIANSVAPSINAAAIIIVVRMSPVAAGWRAVPSIAAAASRPMPIPAPRTANPAPNPAERNARAKLVMTNSITPFKTHFSVGAVSFNKKPLAAARSPGLPQLCATKRSRAYHVGNGVIMALAALERMAMLVVMAGRDRHADEKRGKHGEDVGLDQAYEHLQKIDTHREQHGHWSDRHGSQKEDQRNEEKNHDVPSQHVRKQSDGQSKRFGEKSQDLDRDHDNPQAPVDPSGKVLQVATEASRSNSGHLGQDERTQGQAERDREVGCCGGHPGKQPEEIHEEDEKENAEQIRRVTRPLFRTNVLDCELVANEQNRHFPQVGDGSVGNQVPLVAIRTKQNTQQQQRSGQPHHYRVLGNREI